MAFDNVHNFFRKVPQESQIKISKTLCTVHFKLELKAGIKI